MKPSILLAANQNKEYYIDAVNLCGGIADAKYCPDVSLDYDGLILCGGNDTDPKYYNQDNYKCINIDAKRDEAEFALAKAFVEAKKPILGICRGAQLLNILFGGELHQDLINADMHIKKAGVDSVHSVRSETGSLCHKLYGEEFFVNSAHHQAVSIAGSDLKVTAWSGDVIEAFEHTELPILGLQWHPERMCFSKARKDTVDGSKIFEYFIELCKKQA